MLNDKEFLTKLTKNNYEKQQLEKGRRKSRYIINPLQMKKLRKPSVLVPLHNVSLNPIKNNIERF